LKSDRGEIVFWAPVPTVLLHVVRGHGDVALGEIMVRELRRVFEGKRDILSFFDGLAFTGYDTGFRTRLSDLFRQQVDAGQLKRINLLTRSKLVAMGAAVVNLAIGSKIDVFSDIAVFENLLTGVGAAGSLSRTRAVV
jgi:hypothetical protein